ncbi:MAG: ROK family protein [Rhodospirillales bacterium]|nr:ROK family protein [Rhodospirillales bacterium]
MTGRLVADVGGTQARFAIVLPNGQITRRIDYRTRDFPSFSAALSRYRAESAVARGAISEAAVAGAGPLQDSAIKLTNAPWVLELDVLKRLMGVQRAVILNDLAAAAHALPLIGPDQRRTLHPGAHHPGDAQLIVGLGTGLGMAILQPLPGGRYLARGTELGHSGCLPLDLARRAEAGTWSLEHWICGTGLARLYRQLTGEDLPPEEVAAASSLQARRTRRVFAEATAAVLRDAALTAGAFGGISLIGSISHALADELAAAMEQVLAGPHPMRDLVRELPVALILHRDPALMGLAALPLG